MSKAAAPTVKAKATSKAKAKSKATAKVKASQSIKNVNVPQRVPSPAETALDPSMTPSSAVSPNPTATKTTSFAPPRQSAEQEKLARQTKDRDDFAYRYKLAPPQVKDEMALLIQKFSKKSPEVDDLWWAIRGVDRSDYSSIVLKYSVTHSNTSGTLNRKSLCSDTLASVRLPQPSRVYMCIYLYVYIREFSIPRICFKYHSTTSKIIYIYIYIHFQDMGVDHFDASNCVCASEP